MNNVTTLNDYYQQTYNDSDEYVMVNFTSDYALNKRGFRIEYYTGNMHVLSNNITLNFQDI